HSGWGGNVGLGLSSAHSRAKRESSRGLLRFINLLRWVPAGFAASTPLSMKRRECRGLLPPPLAGEGWGGGRQLRSVKLAPSQSSPQSKSGFPDFDQLNARRTPASRGSRGGGDAVALPVATATLYPRTRCIRGHAAPPWRGRAN